MNQAGLHWPQQEEAGPRRRLHIGLDVGVIASRLSQSSIVQECISYLELDHLSRYRHEYGRGSDVRTEMCEEAKSHGKELEKCRHPQMDCVYSLPLKPEEEMQLWQEELPLKPEVERMGRQE